MSDSVKQITRQLTIKTGSLKRQVEDALVCHDSRNRKQTHTDPVVFLFGHLYSLAKEVDLYKKEYAEQSHVVERLSSANGDEWELKNAVSIHKDVLVAVACMTFELTRPRRLQRKVLKDCEQMIAPSQERVKEAFDDLSALIVSRSLFCPSSWQLTSFRLIWPRLFQHNSYRLALLGPYSTLAGRYRRGRRDRLYRGIWKGQGTPRSDRRLWRSSSRVRPARLSRQAFLVSQLDILWGNTQGLSVTFLFPNLTNRTVKHSVLSIYCIELSQLYPASDMTFEKYRSNTSHDVDALLCPSYIWYIRLTLSNDTSFSATTQLSTSFLPIRSARLVGKQQSTQSDGPPSGGQDNPSGMSLDPLFEEHAGLRLFLGQQSSRILSVELGRGRLGVRVERVGSLGLGLFGERQEGLVQRGDCAIASNR
jgi:hypothetical protein